MQLILFIFSLSIKQIAQESIICDGINEPYASEFLFISTKAGILKFDRTSRAWTRISTLTGLPDNNMKAIALNEGLIWVGTEKGIASADIRLNDWQVYPFEFSITGIDFDDEYVWISSKSGLFRMDKYTEKWDTIINKKINAIYSEGDHLWLGTDDGILRYSHKYEKMEKIAEISPIKIDLIIGNPEKIWFLSEGKFFAYDRITKSWREYEGIKIKDYQNIGDSLFILTEKGLIYFNPQIEDYREFVELGDVGVINGFSANYKNLLLATNNGILIYNLKDRSRHYYNRANGLSLDTIIDVYEDNRFIFAIGENQIHYLDKDLGIWQIERFEIPKDRRVNRILYYDNNGLNIKFHKEIDTRLQGRIYNSGSLRSSNSGKDTTLYRNLNIKLISQHKSNRLLSMYYDDTDREQTFYGFGYRGLDKDFLYRLNGGYLRSGYYEFNMVPEFSTLGGDAKLKYNEHILNIQGGYIKSSLKKDFFYGRQYDKLDTIMDIDFQKNIFYYIYDGPRRINKGFDTIFIDDRIQVNNRIDTRIGMTIAGITGDFDPLINGIDYIIDYENGIIHLLNPPRAPNAVIVISINGEEILIKSDTVFGHQLENIYFLGPKIIPNTLALTIIDTAGMVHPLSEFGLDMDNDNKVDPQFINCDLGYLKFPARRPFPDQVYDDTLHIYSMIISYSTISTFFNLSFNPVFAGSEKVYVDGELVSRGSDYILDYTSGRLIFIKRGLVSDLSEIEVQYIWVQRQGKEIYYSVQPNIAIERGINIAPGMAVVGSESLLFFAGKIKKVSENKGFEFIPQIAVNQRKEYAQNYELLINYNWLGLNTSYSDFNSGFETFGINQKRYGELGKNYGLGLRIEPTTNIKIEGDHKTEYQIDSLNKQHTLKYNYFKFIYTHPELPGGYVSLGRHFLSEYDRKNFQVGLDYNTEVKKTKLKFNTIVNNDQIDSDSKKDKNFGYYLNTNVSMPFPISCHVDLRNSNLYDFNEKVRNENELRLTLNVDIIPGIYYTTNYEGNTIVYNLTRTKDLFLSGYFFNNINIAPGIWHRKISFINLGFGFGNNFNEYLSNVPENFTIPKIFINPISNNNISTISNSNIYFGMIQLTPISDLSIWLKEGLTETGYSYYSTPIMTPTYTDETKVEYNTNRIGLLSIYYTRKRAYFYPARINHNLYFAWNKSWSALLRTKLYTDFQNNTNNYGWVKTMDYKIKLGNEFLFQFNDKNFLFVNIGGAKNAFHYQPAEYSLIPGAGFNLNLIKFLYIQFDYQSEISKLTIVHNFSAKLIGQF